MTVPSLKTERDANGHFLPGNQVGKGWAAPGIQRLGELRAAFLACVTPEKIAAIEAAMLDIALNCDDWRGRLAGQIEWLNRVYGRPKESVDINLDSGTGARPMIDLSAEDVQVLDRIFRKPPPALPSGQDAAAS
jgi:hypothetical protein